MRWTFCLWFWFIFIAAHMPRFLSCDKVVLWHMNIFNIVTIYVVVVHTLQMSQPWGIIILQWFLPFMQNRSQKTYSWYSFEYMIIHVLMRYRCRKHTLILHWSTGISSENVWTALVNSLRPRQNGRHFADDIFKSIFVNENIGIPIKISLNFVPKGSISNIPALVQIMAWRRPGVKPLSEPMLVSLPTHTCVTRPQWVKC